MNKDDLNQITERLDIIIKVLSIHFIEEGMSVKDQVEKLLAIGLLPAQIAKLLGKPLNNITSYASQLRKGDKKNE